MIGQIITDPKTGNPLDQAGNILAKSQYQPSTDVLNLFQKIQHDYQIAYNMQHRGFAEFDGVSLLTRARLDQETFSAYVGAEFVPQHKRWRWKGRKNTARNKIIYILARAISGMLYPRITAKNEDNEMDELTGRVMQILVKDFLHKAKYDVSFLFFALSALVNPATIVEVEFVEALITVKKKLADGSYKLVQAVDELLSGLKLHIVPIDEILFPDYYSGTGNIQVFPVIQRVRRISYDQAKAIYSGCYFDEKGNDLFSYVQSGKTRLFAATTEGQTLFDVDLTETDRNYVQVVSSLYRSEDLEIDTVGGVLMVNYKDVFNSNPFKHRRMTLIGGEWLSIPVYNLAMSGFEPLDPAGRFLWYKSAAFKEFWDDATLNKMHQLAVDGTFLDVIKPTIVSGMAKVDSTVMVPGGTFGVPAGAQISQYQLGPNLRGAWEAVDRQSKDMDDSTKANPVSSDPKPGVTATQTDAALQQAKLFFSVFSLMLADLIRQIGELSVDVIIMHATVGDLDTSVPGTLAMKYKSFLVQGKEKGKTVNHNIVFTHKHMNKEYSESRLKEIKWNLSDKAAGIVRDKNDQKITGKDELEGNQLIYEVNPYKVARHTYTSYVDADEIIRKSLGAERSENLMAFNILTDPRVAPYTDKKAVVEDFAIEKYGGDDPDKYKAKADQNPDMLNSIMGGGDPGAAPPTNPAAPAPGASVVPQAVPQLTQ